MAIHQAVLGAFWQALDSVLSAGHASHVARYAIAIHQAVLGAVFKALDSVLSAGHA